MNPLFLLFGLLGVFAATSGGGSARTTEIVQEGQTGEPEDDLPAPAQDEPQMPMDGEDHEGHDMGHDMGGETGEFLDITAFGMHHGTSSHTHEVALEGGRTPITTEAIVAYNGLREFLGLDPVDIETVGEWAFDQGLTNNAEAYGEDLFGVGLWYGMQGAKVGWIDDEKFDPQILADIQRTARLGETEDVMGMVGTYGIEGFGEFLHANGLVESFVNTLKMEPHYGGWMHGRTHGWLEFDAENGETAIAHDINHLTVLSHDQTQPFMNDTFDWPQWPALEMAEADVLDYFQSMVLLSDPQGPGIEASDFADAAPLAEDIILIALSGDPVDEAMPEPEEEAAELELL